MPDFPAILDCLWWRLDRALDRDTVRLSAGDWSDETTLTVALNPKIDQTVEGAREQVAAIIDTQDPATGLWWTVINRPGETYLETSASALFIYGMARGWRYGYLGDEVLPAIALGLEGLATQIVDGDGQPFDPSSSTGAPVVTGTSQPTSVGTFDYYANIGVQDDIPYGIGAVLLALTETSGLPLPE